MQNARVKEYFLTENNKWECKVRTEQNPVIFAGNVSHFKNHKNSKQEHCHRTWNFGKEESSKQQS